MSMDYEEGKVAWRWYTRWNGMYRDAARGYEITESVPMGGSDQEARNNAEKVAKDD